MRVFALVEVRNPEMPTSGNLKSGDSFFFAFPPPPPPEYQWLTPLPNKHNSIQFLIGSGHYMKSYMRYRTITISVYDSNGEILFFVTDEIHVKMPQKPNFDWKKIRILGVMGKNSKLKHRKARFYPGDLLTCTGGDCCRIGGELARMIITLDN